MSVNISSFPMRQKGTVKGRRRNLTLRALPSHLQKIHFILNVTPFRFISKRDLFGKNFMFWWCCYFCWFFYCRLFRCRMGGELGESDNNFNRKWLWTFSIYRILLKKVTFYSPSFLLLLLKPITANFSHLFPRHRDKIFQAESDKNENNWFN